MHEDANPADSSDPLLQWTERLAAGEPIDWSQAERELSPDLYLALKRLAGLVRNFDDLRQADTGPKPPLDDAVLRRWLAGQTTPGSMQARGAGAAADSGLAAGDAVGEFLLLTAIGSGGMGTVWKARHRSFEQYVAIKFLHLHGDARFQRRFEREQALVARLDHPGLVRMIASGEHRGQPWFAMDWVDGVHLDRWRQQKQPTVRQCLEIVIALCEALHYAHQHLIVHRDLKPSNILIDAHGRVRLIDFGIARQLDQVNHATREQRWMTLAYAAPEQVNGDDVSILTDVHAAGVVLHELLTGRTPHHADTRDEVGLSLVKAIASDPVPPPSVSLRNRSSAPGPIRPEQLSGDLDAIVLKALAKKPHQRYSTAQAFADDMRAFLAQRPIHARTASFPYRARMWLVRNRLAAALGVAMLLGLSGGVALLAKSRAEAMAHAARADATKRFVIQSFASANPWRVGRAQSTRELALRGLAAVAQELADQPEARIEMYETLSEVLARSGPSSAALKARQLQIEEMRALGGYSEDRWIAVHQELAQHHWWAEDIAGAEQVLRDLEREHRLDRFDALQVLQLRAFIASYLGDGPRFEALAERMSKLVEASPAPAEAARATSFLRQARSHLESMRLRLYGYQRRDAQAVASALALLDVADQDLLLGDVNRGAFAKNATVVLLAYRHDAAAEVMGNRVQSWIVGQFGDSHEFVQQLNVARIRAATRRQDLAQAEALFAETLPLLENPDVSAIFCREAWLLGGQVRIAMGDAGGARERLEQALACARRLDGDGFESGHAREARAGLIYLDVLDGRATPASLEAAAAEQAAKDDGGWWLSALWLSQAHLAAGDAVRARQVASALVDWHRSRGAFAGADVVALARRLELELPDTDTAPLDELLDRLEPMMVHAEATLGAR